MEIIPEVANSPPYISVAEFCKLTIYNEYGNAANTSTYTFSSAYKNETIDGTEYLALGPLVAVGNQPSDLRVTSAETSITLAGIPNDTISAVLNAKVKGSKLEILRGFYNENQVLTNAYPRFAGIVTNYAIVENREGIDDTYVITVNASSYKVVLENRIAGRKTNKSSWQVFNPTDSSMNNVYSIADQQFDFGMDASKKAATSSSSATHGRYGQPIDTTNIRIV